MAICRKVGSFFVAGCIGVILFSACRSKSFEIRTNNMENTIKKNSIVYYEKDEVKRNDIVIFQYINKALKHDDGKAVMRVVGVPGDSIYCWEGALYINAKQYPLPGTAKEPYIVDAEYDIFSDKLEPYTYSKMSKTKFQVNLSPAEYKELLTNEHVDSIYQYEFQISDTMDGIIKGMRYQNTSYFGPLVIPRKGTVIDENIMNLLVNYYDESWIGKEIPEDFFFMICDNRYSCFDSKFIGLVPKSKIFGVVKEY